MIGLIVQALLVVVVLCLSILYLYLRNNYGYWKERGVPYEEPTMFVGNLGGAMRTSPWDILYNLMKKHKDKDYVGIFLAHKPTLLINSKELAKNVLVQDFENFQNRYAYPGHQDSFGAYNLFSVKTPLWAPMRQELTPMFTSLRLKGMTELMNMNCAELVERIQTDYVENKKPVDLKQMFSMYASDTVGYTAFGLRVSVLKDLTSPIWIIARYMGRFTFWRGFEFITVFLIPVLANIMNFKFFSASANEYVRRLFRDVVDKRRHLDNADTDRDLVGYLLKVKEKSRLPADTVAQLGEDLMMGQAALFVFGSVVTSSTVLSYLLHELAYHPEEQEKLYQESKQAMQAKNKQVLDFNDLVELSYLTACIKETLRKYPTHAYLDRVCNKEYKLNNEVTIEEGTPVYVNVLAIHYNEEYYPKPKEWRRERFSGATDNDNHDFTFIAFGDGPRSCIGKRYGYMQIRCALVHMIMKYRFDPDEPYIVENNPFSLILAPNSGGKVKFVPR